MSDKISNVEIVPEDIEVTITLSSAIYYRINQLLLNYFPFKDLEEVKSTFEKVANNDERDPAAYHLRTLLAIQTAFEEEARKQDLLKVVQVDNETGKLIED